MAIGPRMEPLDVTSVFVLDDGNAGATYSRLVALFDDPARDGVQWNYNLGGDAAAWSHPYAGYIPGLNDGLFPDPQATITYQTYSYRPTYEVTPGVIDTSEYMSDAWYSFIITNPTVVSRYHTTQYKMTYGAGYGTTDAPLIPGIHKVHGVACVSHQGNLPSQDGYAVYHGRPVWYEAWFSQNEQRVLSITGYNGYTSFWGRQEIGGLMDEVLENVPGAWIRRYVQGAIKRAASPATCTSADIMFGTIVTGTGTSTTLEFCINGVVQNTYTFPEPATYAGMQLIMELSGVYNSGLTHRTGGSQSTMAFVGNVTYSFSTDQWNTAFSPLHPQYTDPNQDHGWDTYDIKYVWYADIPSTHPVGQPYMYLDSLGATVPARFWFESPNMYTHPGWPVAPDGYTNTTSTITTNTPSLYNNATTTNQYALYTGNVYTNHVDITSAGEIVVDGSTGAAGDILASSGPEYPVYWDTFLSQLVTAEDRVAALVPAVVIPPMVPTTSWPITANSGAQYTITTSVTGGNPPYTYAHTATGISVTIPQTANPTFTLPTLAPGSANQTFTLSTTYADTPIVPGYVGVSSTQTSTTITLIAPPAAAGSISAATIPLLGAASLPLIQNGSVDDGFKTIALPFSVKYLGTFYDTIYIGSNSYATFVGGSTAYSGLGATNPPYPGIHINAADNSYQRVYAGAENGGTTFRIRFEGNNSTSGTVGASSMIWELTFAQATPDVIKLSIGNNSRSGSGVSGCTSGSSYVLAIPSVNANTGYNITSA